MYRYEDRRAGTELGIGKRRRRRRFGVGAETPVCVASSPDQKLCAQAERKAGRIPEMGTVPVGRRTYADAAAELGCGAGVARETFDKCNPDDGDDRASPTDHTPRSLDTL